MALFGNKFFARQTSIRYYNSISKSITGNENSSWKSKKMVYLGVISALLSALLGSVKGLLVNKLSYTGPIEIFGIRSLGTIFITLPYLIQSRQKIIRDFKTNLWLLLMSIIGNIAVTGYYYGFAYLPMGIASVIYYSCPLYTTILGCIFLREACGRIEIISVAILLLGLVLVASPWTLTGGDAYSILGLVGSLTGAVAQAIAFLILRKLKDTPAVVITVWWSAVGIILSTIIIISANSFEKAACGLDGLMTIGIAFLGTLGSLTMTFALSKCEAGTVSIALTSEIVFAFVLQVSSEKLPCTATSLIGGSLMLVSIIGTFIVKKKFVTQN